jgi:hypothetical protein
MFSCWVSFFLSWVSDSCIWANNFLPAGPRVGCRAGFEPGAAVQQPSTLTTKPCCTLRINYENIHSAFEGLTIQYFDQYQLPYPIFQNQFTMHCVTPTVRLRDMIICIV